MLSKKCKIVSGVGGLIIIAGIVIGVLASNNFFSPSIPLKVGALQGTSSTYSANGRRLSSLTPTKRPRFSTYAHLDGLIINVALVRVAETTTHVISIANWGASIPVEINPSIKTANFATSANAPYGPYIEADLIFWNRYQIKAHCSTQDYFVYTTTTGVKRIPITNTTDINTPPSDYDYQTLSWMQGDFFTGDWHKAMDQHDWIFINSMYKFSLSASSTLNILVDGSYITTCVDGTAVTDSDAMKLLPPFQTNANSNAQNGGVSTAPYDLRLPAIDFQAWSLPVFIDVQDSAMNTNLQLVGETYAFASAISDLPPSSTDPAADWSKVNIATIAWNGDNLSSVSIRGKGSVFSGQQTANFTTTDGGTSWSFAMGSQYYMSYDVAQFKIVNGFIKATATSGVQSLTFVDGPDCGKQIHTGWMVLPCNPGVTTTLYYRYMERQ